jgi:diguanylate cyclase (GGDEF)-like protein
MDAVPDTHRATWLCPDPASRERLLDMDERLKRPRAAALGILGLALLASVPQLGWLPVGMFVLAVVGFALAGAVQSRLDAPEYAIAASWTLSQVGVAFVVALTGGAHSFGIAWFVVPLITLPARFGARVVAAGVIVTSALLVAAVLLGPDAHDLPDGFGLLYPITAMIGVAMLSTALMRSDLEHRSEAVVDGLTGLLNRRALGHRMEELEAQAAVTRQPIAVIAGDIDRFKQVNDVHGHAKGDAVLVEVAYRIRKRLRAFDLAYRLGGEEFAIVLPGATPQDAAALAEDLRAAIASQPLAGLEVTMSFGVAGSGDAGFDGRAVLATADEALYAAKAAGRDRVFMDGAVVAAA